MTRRRASTSRRQGLWRQATEEGGGNGKREEETAEQELSPAHGAVAIDASYQQHGTVTFGAMLFALAMVATHVKKHDGEGQKHGAKGHGSVLLYNAAITSLASC
jgi:hypothetical protein